MTMTIQWGAHTDPGPRRRNEDCVQVLPELAAAVLADGMGGAAGGREASTLAVATALERLAAELPLGTPGAEVPVRLARLVAAANAAVYAKSVAEPSLRGMGSTLVVWVARGRRFHCANVGDSRAYRLRGGMLEQVSHDHSFVQERVDAGLITAEEAAHQPDRNVLTRAIGTTPVVEPHLAAGELAVGDVILLTSDGVHGAVPERQLAAVAAGGPSHATARRLVEAALAAGTRDNATAAVGRVVEMGDGADRSGDPDAARTSRAFSLTGSALSRIKARLPFFR